MHLHSLSQCDTLDLKMKDNGSSTSRMINRNWVLKRKRRRLPCGQDVSNGKEDNSLALESPRNNSSGKRRLKGDINSVRSASKKKGNDGVRFDWFNLVFLLIYFYCL